MYFIKHQPRSQTGLPRVRAMGGAIVRLGDSLSVRARGKKFPDAMKNRITDEVVLRQLRSDPYED